MLKIRDLGVTAVPGITPLLPDDAGGLRLSEITAYCPEENPCEGYTEPPKKPHKDHTAQCPPCEGVTPPPKPGEGTHNTCGHDKKASALPDHAVRQLRQQLRQQIGAVHTN